MIRSVVIIGSGNLAEALARAVAASPLGLRQVFGRNRDRVAAVAALSGTVGESDPSRLARADTYLIAVSDAAVAEGASRISATKSLPHRGRLHRIAMTKGVLQHTQSASARSYLSASACMVPSAFSASKASSTAAAASLPLRNATPYSSAFSSSTIFRSA